jgi:hypothetical protein
MLKRSHDQLAGSLTLSAQLAEPDRWHLARVDSRAVVKRTCLYLPGNLPLQDWCRIGSELVAVTDSSSWWIGDWLVYGHDKYPHRYRRAMADTGLDYQTLRNYAWVARAFEPSRRRDNLSFQHHMEVAALPREEQDHWLDFAVRLKWSRNVLRRQVRVNLDNQGSTGTRRHHISIQLDIGKDRYERWAVAAGRDNMNLQDWIIDVLDGAITKGGHGPVDGD